MPASSARRDSGRRSSPTRRRTSTRRSPPRETERAAPVTWRMTYTVKEVFYTLQGEGAQAGRPAVFLRFSGCNLWTGRERHRASAVCQFCDTDFVGGDRFSTARELAAAVRAAWGGGVDGRARPYVVCTGGEPLLQLDA